MRFSTFTLGGALLLATATPAFAQDAPAGPADAPKAVTITGGATVVTDYRFRGLTQSDDRPALQGTVNLNHSSGFYVGTWASMIDGGADGSTPALTNYGGAEVDLYAGFTKTLPSGVGIDVGLLYYYYPGGKSTLNTDFFEPYASLSYTIGPVTAKVGGNYAWGGQAGLDFTAGNDDSLYLYGELGTGIPGTPVSLKAHVGNNKGSLGLFNPTTADDSYLDWSLTAEMAKGHFKAGVSYVDTDITNDNVVGIGNFAQKLDRGATVLGYIGATF